MELSSIILIVLLALAGIGFLISAIMDLVSLYRFESLSRRLTRKSKETVGDESPSQSDEVDPDSVARRPWRPRTRHDKL